MNPFNSYPTIEVTETKELPKSDFTFQQWNPPKMQKFLANFSISYMRAHSSARPVVAQEWSFCGPKAGIGGPKAFMLTQDPTTTTTRTRTINEWVEARAQWEQTTINCVVQPFRTVRGIHMCYGLSFPALTLLNVGIFHHLGDQITDYVVTGDDASSTMDDEKSVNSVRDAQRKMGFIPNTAKEYVSENGYVHAEQIFLKEKNTYRRVPMFKMKSILGLGKGRKAGYQWCTVPRTTYENIGGLPEVVQRRVFEYLFAKYREHYELLYNAGVDIFAIPAKPMFPYRLLPPKPNRLSDAVREGKLDAIRTLFTPRPIQPWPGIKSLTISAAALDQGREINEPRYSYFTVGKIPDRLTRHWLRYRTIDDLTKRLSYLTHNPYREAGEVETPRFTGMHALMRYLKIAGGYHTNLAVLNKPADPVYSTISSDLSDDKSPPIYIKEPKGPCVFVDLANYSWKYQLDSDFKLMKPIVDAIGDSPLMRIKDLNIIFVREKGSIEYATQCGNTNVYVWNRNDEPEHTCYINYARWAKKHHFKMYLLTFDQRLCRAVEREGVDCSYYNKVHVDDWIGRDIERRSQAVTAHTQHPAVVTPAQTLQAPPRRAVVQDIRELFAEVKYVYLQDTVGIARYNQQYQPAVEDFRANPQSRIRQDLATNIGATVLIEGQWKMNAGLRSRLAQILTTGKQIPEPAKGNLGSLLGTPMTPVVNAATTAAISVPVPVVKQELPAKVIVENKVPAQSTDQAVPKTTANQPASYNTEADKAPRKLDDWDKTDEKWTVVFNDHSHYRYPTANRHLYDAMSKATPGKIKEIGIQQFNGQLHQYCEDPKKNADNAKLRNALRANGK